MNRRDLIASVGAAVAMPAALVAAPRTVTVTICGNFGFDEYVINKIIKGIREAVDRRDVIVFRGARP